MKSPCQTCQGAPALASQAGANFTSTSYEYFMRLSELISTNVFNPYVQKLVEEKTPLLASGIVARSPELEKFLAAGCLTAAGDSGEAFIRCTRTQQWGASKLQSCVSDTNAMTPIAGRISDYESRQLTRQLLSVFKGVFAGKPEGMTLDVTGTSFVPFVTTPNRKTIANVVARHTNLSILLCHSAVYGLLRNTALIDFTVDPVTGESIPTLDGIRLVFDDGMPKTDNVYTSYLCGRGALEVGFNQLPDATAVEQLPDDLSEIISRKWQNGIRVPGFSWAGDLTAKGGPTNSELASASSWKKSALSDSPVKMVQITTREA